jgi:type I restriction enzyme M protein
MTNKYEPLKEIIETGEKEGFFRLKENKIEYIAQRKSYKISDPEEQVRAAFYLELIQKYQYPKERIGVVSGPQS